MSASLDTAVRAENLSSLFPTGTFTAETLSIPLKDCFMRLRQYELILVSAESALAHLQAGALQAFDAVGGDFACQGRAFKIASLAKKTLETMSELKGCILEALRACRELSSKIKPDNPHRLKELKAIYGEAKTLSLKELLTKFDLDLPVTQGEKFLITAHILSMGKLVGRFPEPSQGRAYPAVYDQKKLRNVLDPRLSQDLTGSFLNSLVKDLQYSLCQSTVDFVRERLPSAPEAERIGLLLQLNPEARRPVLPSFPMNEVLFETALQENTPIAVVVRQIDEEDTLIESYSFLLRPNGTKTDYERVPMGIEIDPTKACIVIEGVSLRDKAGFEELLSTHSLKTLFFANSTYCDAEPDAPTGEHPFRKYREIANIIGCTPHDARALLIDHVFVTSIDQIKTGFCFTDSEGNVEERGRVYVLS